MKIGNVQLKNDLILAPMANYTDAGMRYLASVYGAGLTVTEMVSAKGLCFNNPNTRFWKPAKGEIVPSPCNFSARIPNT